MTATIKHVPKISFAAFIVGCSGSGKTVFYTNLLKHWDTIFDEKIGKLIIVYGFYQKAYDTLQEIFEDSVRLETDLTEDMLESSENNNGEQNCTVITNNALVYYTRWCCNAI